MGVGANGAGKSRGRKNNMIAGGLNLPQNQGASMDGNFTGVYS